MRPERQCDMWIACQVCEHRMHVPPCVYRRNTHATLQPVELDNARYVGSPQVIKSKLAVGLRKHTQQTNLTVIPISFCLIFIISRKRRRLP